MKVLISFLILCSYSFSTQALDKNSCSSGVKSLYSSFTVHEIEEQIKTQLGLDISISTWTKFSFWESFENKIDSKDLGYHVSFKEGIAPISYNCKALFITKKNNLFVYDCDKKIDFIVTPNNSKLFYRVNYLGVRMGNSKSCR